MNENQLRSPDLPDSDDVAKEIAKGVSGDESSMKLAIDAIATFEKNARYLSPDHKSMRAKEQQMLDGFLAKVSNKLHDNYHVLPGLKLVGADEKNHLLQAVDGSHHKYWIDETGKSRSQDQYQNKDVQETCTGLADCMQNRGADRASDFKFYSKKLGDQLASITDEKQRKIALTQVNRILREDCPGLDKVGVVVGASAKGLMIANPSEHTIGMIGEDFQKYGLLQMSKVPMNPGQPSFGNPGDYQRYPNRNPNPGGGGSDPPIERPGKYDRSGFGDDDWEEIQQELEKQRKTAEQLNTEAQAAEGTQRAIKLAWGALGATAVIATGAYFAPAAGAACVRAWQWASSLGPNPAYGI